MPAIKLFALSTCSHCRHTKEYLNDNNVDFDCTEVDVLTGDERQKVIEEVKKYNPDLSFPTLVIGDTVIVGFKKDEIAKTLGL